MISNEAALAAVSHYCMTIAFLLYCSELVACIGILKTCLHFPYVYFRNLNTSTPGAVWIFLKWLKSATEGP